MSKLISDKSALLSVFPITRNENMEKLADAIAGEFVKLTEQTDQAEIFLRVDELPEGVLDILADDLKVDWYDFEGSIEEKRKTIRECMNIHRYKGTKYAVEAALKGVYDEVYVKEWFEYGGEPFHFKVIIYDSSNDKEKRSRILAKVQYYKNLRSVLEETVFEIGISSDIAVKAAFRPGSIYKRIYCEVKNYGLE